MFGRQGSCLGPDAPLPCGSQLAPGHLVPERSTERPCSLMQFTHGLARPVVAHAGKGGGRAGRVGADGAGLVVLVAVRYAPAARALLTQWAGRAARLQQRTRVWDELNMVLSSQIELESARRVQISHLACLSRVGHALTQVGVEAGGLGHTLLAGLASGIARVLHWTPGVRVSARQLRRTLGVAAAQTRRFLLAIFAATAQHQLSLCHAFLHQLSVPCVPAPAQSASCVPARFNRL